MKFIFVVLCALVIVVCVSGQGFPTKKCPAGEHSVLYCPRKAEPSCDNPTVHEYTDGKPRACDIPDCFCDTPTVRDTSSGQCVPLAQCPEKIDTSKACCSVGNA